jgi:hypothetical protein
MGFNVVDASLDKEAIVKLQIASNPPTRMLLTSLLGTPPRDQALSRKYYEYLASRIAGDRPFLFSSGYKLTRFIQILLQLNLTGFRTPHSYLLQKRPCPPTALRTPPNKCSSRPRCTLVALTVVEAHTLACSHLWTLGPKQPRS